MRKCLIAGGILFIPISVLCLGTNMGIVQSFVFGSMPGVFYICGHYVEQNLINYTRNSKG